MLLVSDEPTFTLVDLGELVFLVVVAVVVVVVVVVIVLASTGRTAEDFFFFCGNTFVLLDMVYVAIRLGAVEGWYGVVCMTITFYLQLANMLVLGFTVPGVGFARFYITVRTVLRPSHRREGQRAGPGHNLTL